MDGIFVIIESIIFFKFNLPILPQATPTTSNAFSATADFAIGNQTTIHGLSTPDGSQIVAS